VPDGENNLWITTREGLSVYNKKTGVFKNFRHNPADATSLDNDQFATVYITKNNSAWFSTPSSLYYFDSLLQYRKAFAGIKDIRDFENKKIESYGKIIEDRQGNLWGYAFSYVFLINKKTMQVAKTFGPFKGNLTDMYQDSDFQFWISSFGGGLIKFNPAANNSLIVNLANSNTIANSVADWWDQHHKRWLAVGGDHGLILVDPVTLKSREYTFHLGYFPQQILKKNEVNNVFVDRQNILWVATEAGICYAKPSRQLYDLWNISDSSGILPTTVADWVYSLCETSNRCWMTRWSAPGLYCYDKNGNHINTIKTVKTNHSSFTLSDSLKPFYICNQEDSVIWFTTNKYLVHYDVLSKKAVLYKPSDGNAFTGLRTITRVDKHHWWIRTRNNGPNGIYIFDPVDRKFIKHYTNYSPCNNCVPPKLLTVFFSNEKELYVTAIGSGLLKYDPQSDNFVPVFKFEGADLKQHSNSFECVSEDNNGIFWIGSFAGLFTFDPKSKKIIHDYASNELLGGVEISGIVFDEQQNAWLSTERGIYYILHSTNSIRQLSNTEGITNNSIGTFQQGSDHSIYLGVQGYMLRIYPSQLLNQHDQNVAVHFSDATVMDVPHFFHYTSSGEKELIIPPGKNRFTLDFSVLNYDDDNRYYYRVDGLMNSWQQNENGHLAFYNLSPGVYTLHVKGKRTGALLSSEDEVKIIEEPHWWQTSWFKLLVLAIIIVLTTFLVRRRFAEIRRETSFKQKIAETEMMALRSQMNPHFIFNSLNSIENFMMQNEKRLASSYLNKFARLIRMILDSSRTELVPLSKDMEALQLYVDLEQLRFNHKFCFKLNVDPLLLNGDYRVPALLMQPYVENAIVHGLAHSERDDLMLSVTAFLKEEYIHYQIEDNGIGRQLSAQYNQKNKPNHKSLGLMITEERILIFNRQQNANGKVVISDLFDKNHQPSGTKVHITIKAV
jgi:ligand-binding sensor domain-containing protein